MASLRILAVDDYEPFRRFVCSILQGRAEFVEASDGLQAIQKIEKLQPDVILLDLGLPTLNGIEVAAITRNIASNAKIVFVSQESSPEVIEELLSRGAAGYVIKSYARRDLLPAIEAAVQGKRFVSDSTGITQPDKGQPF